MSRPFSKLVVAFVLTTLAGAALHFLHALVPHALTAIFSPVNESVWEHMKILFWPYLAAALILNRRKGESIVPALLSLLIICALMLLAGYLYYIVWFGDNEAFSPVSFVLLMVLGFALPSMIWRFAVMRWSDLVYPAVIVLAAAIVLFTFLPPDHVLFTDLSGANTWEVIPW